MRRRARTSVNARRAAWGGASSLVVAACALASGCSEASETTAAASEPRPDGAALYARYCALCHGANGEGYAADNANALAHPQFLSTASDELLRRAIARGRPGTAMSAWGAEAGGPLGAAQIDAVVKHVRGWQTTPSIDVAGEQVSGLASRAEVFYDVKCKGCHGDEGQGGEFMSVAHPEFLASAPDGYLRRVIVEGRAGTPMPAFGAQLTPQTIDDLVVLLRGWQQDPSATAAQVPAWPPAGPVLNPTGADAAFDDVERFVGVERVWSALSAQGRRLVIADARAPSDYLLEHVAGAVSVPFYDVASFADRLPADVWVVTYCGCPHAASGAAADALLARGFTKVRVLDEGFYEWRTRGYATRSGPDP